MSFRSVFLPLDGSNLAENALPAAAYFARLCGASVALFHVVEKSARNRIHGARHLTRPEEADEYLREAAVRWFPAGAVVRHVHSAAVRDVARSIVEHSREFHSDLIILCAHGSGGARDWLIGNIAQQVIARGSAPVLLLRPSQAPPPGESFSLRSILLPLDGLPEHERCESPAVDLARESGAAVHLATAVPTPESLAGEHAAAGRLLPGSTKALLDLRAEEARKYLLRRLEKMRSLKVNATMEVLRGDPAAVLASLVNRRQDDLIVLGTHGRAGSAAFWNRSVTAGVLRRIRIPALLFPL
jgi:nucleotide-binding universal stress UspA family protein